MNPDMVTAPSGIVYPFWQAGAGAPLVLLHGFTGSHDTWRFVVNQLSTNHLVTTLDLPGHGQSSLSQAQFWGFSSVISDLAWLIESLAGGAANVLGYSMGGRFALALAATHPDHVRRLILESASPGIADEVDRNERRCADDRLADRILTNGVAAFVEQWERLPMWESQSTLSETVQERQRQIRLGHAAAGLAANLRATGTGAQPSYWEQLPGLRPPTLLIAGGLDPKFAQIATAMHDALPDSRLEIVQGAGHAVHLEQPAAYLQRVSQFLDQPALGTMPTQRSNRD